MPLTKEEKARRWAAGYGKRLFVIICDYKTVVFWFQLAGVKNEVVLQAFGQHLRRLREARGWSQQALADVADVS